MYENLYASVPDKLAYLQRLGLTASSKLDKQYLDTLIYAHQCSVAFENLDVCEFHRQISLEIPDLFHKIVVDKRGGYCFELNALFTQLLVDFGYHAYACMCRITRNKDYIPPILHRGIIVELEHELYFCDVGYGGPMPPGAVLIQDGHSVTLHGETFHIRKRNDYWWKLLRTTSSGSLEEVMEFYTMPQENVNFLVLNAYCSQNKDSIFTQKYFINIRTFLGSKSILGDAFTCVENGKATTQEIKDKHEFYQILEQHFHLTF